MAEKVTHKKEPAFASPVPGFGAPWMSVPAKGQTILFHVTGDCTI